MKLYVDYLTNKVEIDRETPFYQSADLVSTIEIDVANITGSYFVSLDFVLPNGHKLSVTTPDPFEDGEDTVVTRNGVTYSINRFTLSSLVLSCAGQLQFTAYANFTEEYTSGTQTLVRVIKKAALGNGVNTILKTANVLGGYILALDTDNASDVVKNLFDEIVRLTGLLSGKASISGSSANTFQASEFTENGITLVNKYHPKGGSGTLDFLVKKLTASQVNVYGTIDTTYLKLNGSDVTNLFHTKGGSNLLDFSAKDLTATNGYFTTLKKNNKDVATEEFVNTSVARDSLVSTIGNASNLLSGLMSATDKARLDVLVALLGSENGDADSVVNTIREVLAIFSQYPEGVTLVTALGGKVDKVFGKGLSANDFTDAYKNKVDKIGDLSSLETTAKSTVVEAINEVANMSVISATTSEIVGLRG